jgi:hypothetical protein
MLTLLSALLVAAPSVDTVPASHAATAAIQITLNNGGNFAPGGMVNVRVQTADDGYLIVFRVDGDGRIRVVFPLDPDADAFVRGGKEYELRGRGDRSTFLADDRGGSGMVYAAIAHDPLVVRDFALNGHWDYNALRLRDSTTDAENDLTAVVSRMTNRAHFDYDAVGYRVQDIAADVGAVAAADGGGYYPGLYDPFYNPRWRCLSCGWGYPGSDLVGFGYSPFYDPFLYSPWGYTSAYAYGYGYGFGYGYGYPGTGWFPVVGNPRPTQPFPAGTRPRPRPPVTGTGSHISAPPSGGRPAAPVATRARPRPADLSVMAPRIRPDERPVFRQPSQGAGAPQAGMRAGPQGQSHPIYREPPQVYRAPPSSSSAPRSAPAAQRAPPPPPSASRGRSGGGHR